MGRRGLGVLIRLSPVKLFHVPEHTEAMLYDWAGLLQRTMLFLWASAVAVLCSKSKSKNNSKKLREEEGGDELSSEEQANIVRF